MNRLWTWFAVCFAIGFPTVVTFSYFAAKGDVTPASLQFRYTVLKTIQFAFPIARILFARRRERMGLPTMHGLIPGLIFGLVITGVMIAGYYFVLKWLPAFDAAGQAAARKTAQLGLDRVAVFAAVGVFYAVCHSLLEEYYWRWFVFGELRELWPKWPAIILSALGFTAHHVIVLNAYFGWNSLATVFFASSITVGGVVWAWMYDRYGSLSGPWISHLLIDAGLFLVGFDMARAAFDM